MYYIVALNRVPPSCLNIHQNNMLGICQLKFVQAKLCKAIKSVVPKHGYHALLLQWT